MLEKALYLKNKIQKHEKKETYEKKKLQNPRRNFINIEKTVFLCSSNDCGLVYAFCRRAGRFLSFSIDGLLSSLAQATKKKNKCV